MIERHLITIMTAIMVALLTWIGYQTQQTTVAVAVLAEKVEAIQVNARRLDTVEQRMRDYEMGGPH